MEEGYLFKVTLRHKHSTPGGMEEEWTIEATSDDEDIVGESVFKMNEVLLNGPKEEERN